MESILTSIKKMIGPEEEVTDFDTDLIIHINSALMILTQLGVGPVGGFSITDSSATWNDFLGDESKIEAVKSYVYMKVKLMFDPPTNSALIEAMNQTIRELEFRINIEAESQAR